jgi:hypothetical protein
MVTRVNAASRLKIAFDPSRHVYRLEGAIVPNVTRVLEDVYDWEAVAAERLERKRQIGQAVHAAIVLDLCGDLDERSLDPQIVGYFEAWRRLLREKRFACRLKECPVGSWRYRYAGTFDLAGEMSGSDALLEVKTSATLSPAAALQTAAYAYAAAEMDLLGSQTKRFALHLGSDGAYRLEPHTGKNDFAVFLACLSRHNWCARHGLLKETLS